MKFRQYHSLLLVLLTVLTLFSSCEFSMQGIREEYPSFCILKFSNGEDFSNYVYSISSTSKQNINSDPTNIVALHGGYYAIQYGVQALGDDVFFYTVSYNNFDSVFDTYDRDAKRFCASEKSFRNPFAEWYESYGFGCVHTAAGCNVDTVAVNNAIDEGRMMDCFVKIK